MQLIYLLLECMVACEAGFEAIAGLLVRTSLILIVSQLLSVDNYSRHFQELFGSSLVDVLDQPSHQLPLILVSKGSPW
jgi:hypothetical protein